MNESESKRFADPILWVVVFFFGLFLYVFAYPPFVMLLDSIFGVLSMEPIDTIIYGSLLPLSWLYDNVSAYQVYADFLENLLL